MKKFLLAMVLAIAPLLSFSSPALQEKQELCKVHAANAAAANDAKNKLKMDEDEFNARAQIWAFEMLFSGVPEQVVKDALEFLQYGYHSNDSVDRIKASVFSKCMHREGV